MDKIYLNGMSFYGYHGVYPEENKLGQRFIVDVVLHADLKTAGQTDNLNQTINYAEVYKLTQTIVEGTPKKLVEAVAEEIAQKLLDQFTSVPECSVKVIKPDPPIPGHYDSVAVEIVRSR